MLRIFGAVFILTADVNFLAYHAGTFLCPEKKSFCMKKRLNVQNITAKSRAGGGLLCFSAGKSGTDAKFASLLCLVLCSGGRLLCSGLVSPDQPQSELRRFATSLGGLRSQREPVPSVSFADISLHCRESLSFTSY